MTKLVVGHIPHWCVEYYRRDFPGDGVALILLKDLEWLQNGAGGDAGQWTGIKVEKGRVTKIIIK